MDQRFESEVMQDLMEGSPPPSSADEFFEEDSFEGEGYEEDFGAEGLEEEALMESADAYDEGNGFEEEAQAEGYEDGFEEDAYEEDLMAGDYAEEEADLAAELEDVVADALDAEDSDEFLGRLIGGISRVAGLVRRGARTARGVAGTVGRVAGQAGRVARTVEGVAGRTRRATRPAAPGRRPRPIPGQPAALQAILGQLLPLLQQQAGQGADELELFEDLADWFEEEEADEALPVLAGIAARAAVRPLIRRTGALLGRTAGRQLVRGAVQAARTLVSRQGPRAVRALPRIARSVGRAAARRGLRPTVVPVAMRRAAARVVAQPALARRLSQPAVVSRRPGVRRRGIVSSGVPRRFTVAGPVELIMRR